MFEQKMVWIENYRLVNMLVWILLYLIRDKKILG